MSNTRTYAFVLAVLALLGILFYDYVKNREAEEARRTLHRLLRVKRAQYLQLLQHREETVRAARHKRRTDTIDQLHTLSMNPQWSHTLALAKMYDKGVYPDFAPNSELAIALYHSITVKCEDVHVVAEARGLLHACSTMAMDATDISGDPLPIEPGTRALSRIQSMLVVPSPVIPKKAKVPSVSQPPVIVSDSQNSHDHGVGACLKRRIDALKKETTDTDHARHDIEEVLLTGTMDMDDEEKARALAVLDTLHTDHTHSLFGVSEVDALGLVWTNIKNLGDDTVRHNATETLCKQVASAYERGGVVCSTGKISRILSSLDGIDETSPSTRPMWAIQEELGTLAAQVRGDVLASAPESRRVMYERGESLDLEHEMRDTFKEKSKALYEGELGVDGKILDPMLKPFLDAF